jgi:hypothetical protein
LLYPFPDAPQFYHHAPCNMTPTSQPTSGTKQGYAICGSPWQGHDFPQGGYREPPIFLHQ